MTSKLTTKQEAFVLAYIGESRFNATRAAIAAGYSERSARSMGSELLTNPDISARVREELSQRTISMEAVLSELSDLALSPDSRFSTTRFDIETGQPVEVRVDLNPRIKAMELLGKAYGAFTERVDVSGTLTAQVNLVGISEDDV